MILAAAYLSLQIAKYFLKSFFCGTPCFDKIEIVRRKDGCTRPNLLDKVRFVMRPRQALSLRDSTKSCLCHIGFTSPVALPASEIRVHLLARWDSSERVMEGGVNFCVSRSVDSRAEPFQTRQISDHNAASLRDHQPLAFPSGEQMTHVVQCRADHQGQSFLR